MSSRFPWDSTSAAKPIGSCHKCGSSIYENLVHHCGTAVRVNLPLGVKEDLPLGVKEGRYDALAARLEASERVRRQLAETLRPFVAQVPELASDLFPDAIAALAASDALDGKGAYDPHHKIKRLSDGSEAVVPRRPGETP